MDYLKIGKIVNTRGIKGELKIRPLTDFQSDRYQENATIYIFYANEYLPFQVQKYKTINNMDILVLKNNEDINLVEKYKGCEIYVESDEHITLFDDEYHLSEMIDLNVYQSNQLVGKVIDIKAYPQGDYLEILTISEKKKYIPFRDEFVPVVNIEEGYINIIDMEGLL